MANNYHGEKGWAFNCSNVDELNGVLERGEWFRMKAMGFYYRNLPIVSHRINIPSNLVCLKMVCITSVTTKYTRFYRIIDDKDNPNSRIYYGESLNQLICEELKSWAMNMNPDTMRAFGGKSFVSYLNAIPREILLQEGFEKRMENALKSGFVKRIKNINLTSKTDLDKIEKTATVSIDVLRKSLKTADENQAKLEKATKDAMKQSVISTIKNL